MFDLLPLMVDITGQPTRWFDIPTDGEHALGRAVPADWAWVNPPLSSSTAATFTREFDTADLDVRPNFVSRPNASGCPHH